MSTDDIARDREGEAAMITGGSEGIGFQVAKELAAKGLTVLLGVLDMERGTRAASTINGKDHAIALDVANPASSAAEAELIRSDLGRFDWFTNHAEIRKRGGLPAGRGLE